MDALVLRILQRIKGECPRRCKDLKASLDTLIAALSNREATGGRGSEETSSDADAYFAPIKDACESKQHRVMEVALEGLHQLIGNVSRNTYTHVDGLSTHNTLYI